jgi:hypothetical protein
MPQLYKTEPPKRYAVYRSDGTSVALFTSYRAAYSYAESLLGHTEFWYIDVFN